MVRLSCRTKTCYNSNMNNKKNYTLGLFCIVILMGAVWFVSRSQEAPTGPSQTSTTTTTQQLVTTSTSIATSAVDSHVSIDETLRDVNFCGKIYKVKQIKIDGVDVVQRVAELVNEPPPKPAKKEICDAFDTALRNEYIRFEEGAVILAEVHPSEFDRAHSRLVFLIAPGASLMMDFLTGDISKIYSAFDGYTTESLGNLQK